MSTQVSDQEVRNRLDSIQRYNDYFSIELDKDGLPLTQHVVGPREIWRIAKDEWKIDPTKFGLVEPPPLPEYNGKPKGEPKPENLSNDF